MLLEELRQKVVEYGNKLISSGLTIGTAGNISMYDPESGYMVIIREMWLTANVSHQAKADFMQHFI